MTIDNLKAQDAKKISDDLFAAFVCLTRLERRLAALIGTDEDYYKTVAAAREAMNTLSVETHYVSCKTGVGRHARD